MQKNPHSAMSSQGTFNTLAQSETETYGKPAIILTGVGSDLNNSKALKGRAKRKLITQKMILGLVDVSNNKGNHRSKRSYWNTFHCQNKIQTAKGRLFGKYCKNRYCTLCCCIRKANIINRYLPVIQNWEEPYFVTLTIRSVPMHKLKPVINSMQKGFTRIIAKYRKKNQRGNGLKLMGVKSLECNFNSRRKTYNPHFHLIVPNRKTANILIKEWLTTSKPGWNLPVAQNMSKVFNNQTALLEVVKYGSKIFTDPDLKKKEKSKGAKKICVAALDNIFNAMKGLRIFERFGFNLPEKNSVNPGGISIVKEYDEWIFDLKQFDWINYEGKKLTDFNPPMQLIELLNNNIDIQLQ
jgi:Replication protein